MTTDLASLSAQAGKSHGAALRLHADAQSEADFDLIRRIAAHDKEAMRALFARHNVRACRFVRRLTGDEALVEDLVSEVFIEVWRNAGRFHGRSRVSTWILGIARFKTLSALRRRTDEALDDASSHGLPDLTGDPEAAAQKKDRLAIVLKCLERLSREQREVIDLVYFQEKSIREVAAIAGVPQSTVKTRMFYARKRMRALLGQAGIYRDGCDHAPVDRPCRRGHADRAGDGFAGSPREGMPTYRTHRGNSAFSLGEGIPL